jgi:hypothetical protein
LSGRLDARIRALLDANPDLALHEMLDPNQDRLMARCMGYFRLKRLRLGESFERFLEENLAQNATIILAECNLGWPATRVGERHVYQFGGLCGATLEELDAIVGEVGVTGCAGPERICEGNSRESSNLSPPTGGCLLDAYLLT